VLDDHTRMAQPPLRPAVVASRILGHLVLAFRPEWDQAPDDVRPLIRETRPTDLVGTVQDPSQGQST
jgi:hypothetical protein